MKDVTDAAGERLLAALDEAVAAEQKCVRLALLLRGLDLTLDEERPGDEVVTCKGRRVLVTDADTAAKWADRTLDYSSEQMSRVGGGHTRPPAG